MSCRPLPGLQSIFNCQLLCCDPGEGRGWAEPWSLAALGPRSAHSHMVIVVLSSILSAFVHRCGRTARIGHGGSALVFLLPMEESYISFLEINQKVSGFLFSYSMPSDRILGRVLFQQAVRNLEEGLHTLRGQVVM